ncbi:MAG: extracellular solute-binding protein [Deltaproteobacteria bacterium]|nr:MAG: extracellular solute-binding protein [Deltaproteobacteria bacterium]
MRVLQVLMLAAVTLWLPLQAPAQAAPAKKAAVKTVVLWHAYRAEEKRALEKVVAAYNRTHKTTQIKMLGIPYDAYADKINAAIPRGHGPDLFIFAHDRVGDWAKNNIIEKITFWVNGPLLARFIPKTVQMLAYNNALYGLPLAFKSLALFYNKKLIKKPPVDTNDMIKQAKALTNRKAQKFGLAYEATDLYRHVIWLHGFGGYVINGSDLGVAKPPSVKALDFAYQLKKTHKVLPDEPTSQLITFLFNKGQAAMVINGPWFRGEIHPKVEYGVVPLPKVSATGKPAAPFLTSEAVFISKKSKQKKLAFEVMKYLTSDDAALTRMKIGKQTVANNAVYQKDYAKKDPIIQAFYKQMQVSVPTPNTPEMRLVWSPMVIALSKVFRGQGTALDALKEAHAEITKYLQRNKSGK